MTSDYELETKYVSVVWYFCADKYAFSIPVMVFTVRRATRINIKLFGSLAAYRRLL